MREGKLHYGWIVIFMGLLTTIAAHGFGRMAYTIILPAMKDGLKFDYTQLGLLGTGNFIGYLTMAIIGGFLAARFGTRIVITLALLVLGITLILTGLAQSFGYALSMRFLTGLGNGAAYVPAMALGSVWFAMKRRGFATGIVSGGIGAGTLISGLLVPPILTAYGGEGWRYAWYTLGAIALVIAVRRVLAHPQQAGRDRTAACGGLRKGRPASFSVRTQGDIPSMECCLWVALCVVPGSGLFFLRFLLHHLYDLFCRIPCERNGVHPGLRRRPLGLGGRSQHLLRDHLGAYFGSSGPEPRCSTGLSRPGIVLHCLCSYQNGIRILSFCRDVRPHGLEHPDDHGRCCGRLCRAAAGACRPRLHHALFWNRTSSGACPRRIPGGHQPLLYRSFSRGRWNLTRRDGGFFVLEETQHFTLEEVSSGR